MLDLYLHDLTQILIALGFVAGIIMLLIGPLFLGSVVADHYAYYHYGERKANFRGGCVVVFFYTIYVFLIPLIKQLVS